MECSGEFRSSWMSVVEIESESQFLDKFECVD